MVYSDKKTIAYRKDDVWLVHFAGIKQPFAILDIAGRCIKHKFGWETLDEFHARAIAKIGRVRRIFGIPLGWKRAA